MESSHQGLFDNCFKCGYCGFLIKSQCEDLLEHRCLKNIYIEGDHDLVEDPNKVLTIVRKQQAHIVGKPGLTEASKETLDETIITLVQDRPPLYNSSLPLSQRTAAKKSALWLEIFNLLGEKISLEDIQKKWKYLRDRYNRAKKRMTEYRPSRSEASSLPDPGFSYYEMMRFVDDGVSDKQTISSIAFRDAGMAEKHFLFSPSTNSSCSTSPGLLSPTLSDGSNPSTAKTTKRASSDDPTRADQGKKKKEESNNPIEKEIATILRDTNKPTDGVDGFLMRLGESLRRMLYRERSKLELEINKLVYETECHLDRQ